MASWDKNVAAAWEATPSVLQFIFSFTFCSFFIFSIGLILDRRFWSGWLERFSFVYYYLFGSLATPLLWIVGIVLTIFFISTFIVGLGRCDISAELEWHQKELSSKNKEAIALSEKVESLKLDHELQSRKHEKLIVDHKAAAESQRCIDQTKLFRADEDLEKTKRLLIRKREEYFNLLKEARTLEVQKANIVKELEEEFARREQQLLKKYQEQKDNFKAKVDKKHADQEIVLLAHKAEAELAKAEASKKDDKIASLYEQIEGLKNTFQEEKQKLEEATKNNSTARTITSFQEIPDTVAQMIVAEHEGILATALETQRLESQKEWEENKPVPVTVEITKTITTVEEIPDSVKDLLNVLYRQAMEAERIEQRRTIEALKKDHEDNIKAMKALYDEQMQKTDLNIRTQMQANSIDKTSQHEIENGHLKSANTALINKYETLQIEVKTLSKEVTEKNKAIESLQIAVQRKDETIQDQVIAVRQLNALRQQPEEPKAEPMEVDEAPKTCHSCDTSKLSFDMLHKQFQQTNEKYVKMLAAQEELIAVCKEETIWEADPTAKLSDLDRVLDSYKEMLVMVRDGAQMRENQELDYDDSLVDGVARLVGGLRQQIEYLGNNDKAMKKKMTDAMSRLMTVQSKYEALFKECATAKGDLQGMKDVLTQKGHLTLMMSDPVAVLKKILAEHGKFAEIRENMSALVRYHQGQIASRDTQIETMKQQLSTSAEAMS